MIKSSFNNDYYEEDGNQSSLLEKLKISFGAISLAASLIIFFSLLSYIFTGESDQSIIDSGLNFESLSKKSQNWLGVAGAFLSHYLVYISFGITSFLIVPFLVVFSFRLLFKIKIISLTRASIFTFFGIIWISSLLGFFLILFPENEFLNNYTGGIGLNFSILLDNLLGISSIIILVLSLFLFIVFYFNISSINFSMLNFNKGRKTEIDSNEFYSDEIIEDEDIKSSSVITEEIKDEEFRDSKEVIVNNKADVSDENKSELSSNDANEIINFSIEKGVSEKISNSSTSNIYDPELDL